MDKSEYQELFLSSLSGKLADLLDLKSDCTASFYMNQTSVQDSFCYRARQLGLKIASLLIKENGDLDLDKLRELNALFKKGFFVLGPDFEGDRSIYEHIESCLLQLEQTKEIWLSLRKFSVPLCHKKAENLIRDTLFGEKIKVLQTAHVRRAALCAWLTFLRQATGSCFATAPAIFIQQKQPLAFFKDLYDLVSLGQLKRTVFGKEFSEPLSFSTGDGGLKRRSILLARSFGLLIALDSVGVKLSREKQLRIQKRGASSAKEILEMILMGEIGITESDIQAEEHLKTVQMSMAFAKHGAVYYQEPSERSKKIAEWKKRVDTASKTFISLTECALLRSWEYTIASFTDIKIEFARWNLYIGLGLHPNEKDGIGAFLHEQINHQFQNHNREIEKLASEYEEKARVIQTLEFMLKGPSRASNHLKSELTAHRLSLDAIVEMRDQLVAKNDALAALLVWLIEQYDLLLQEYFQEIFDPMILTEDEHLFEDSPAGFRLVYKHGRRDASQWSAIKTEDQYVEALRDFFSIIERDLDPPGCVGKELISELTTALIQFIREPRFIHSAMDRAKAKGRKSPWEYISGGTLQTLLMAYHNRSRAFTEKKIVPKSAKEVLEFLNGFQESGPLLMHSPTHAFLFYPEWLKKTAHLKTLKIELLDASKQEHITHKLAEKLPEEERALLIHRYRQAESAKSNLQFRQNLIEMISNRIKNKESLVDETLFENSPLLNRADAQKILNKIFKKLGIEQEKFTLEGSFFGPNDLFQIGKRETLKRFNRAMFDIDWDVQIASSLKECGFFSSSALFADSNWSSWFLGFVIHPLTNQLEIWRLNRTATKGAPLLDWKQWMSPENSSSWNVLMNQSEYKSEE